MTEDNNKVFTEKELHGIVEKQEDSMGAWLQGEFQAAMTHREATQDQKFIKAHRDRKSVVGPEVNIETSTDSKLFMGLTNSRVVIASTHINEALIPVGETNLAIEPTPLPMDDQQLAGMGHEDLQQLITHSREICHKMDLELQDDLLENEWNSITRDTVDDMVGLGTGIICGPFVGTNAPTIEGVEKGLGGGIRPSIKHIYTPRFYPAPGVSKVKDLPYCYVYDTFTKETIVDWINSPANTSGFFTDKLKEVIESQPAGNWSPREWERVLLKSNGPTSADGKSEFYAMLTRWGWLSGEKLISMGAIVPEERKYHQILAKIQLIGTTIVHASVSEMFADRLPFYKSGYFEDNGSFWGVGVPEAMSVSSDYFQALSRAEAHNLATCTGPFAEVDTSRLYDPKQAINIRGWGVVKTKEEPLGGNRGRAIHLDNIPCHLKDIRGTKQEIKQLIEEQTGVPQQLVDSTTDGLHNRTESGARLQFDSALSVIRNVVARYEDNILIPLGKRMKRFYDRYSTYSKSELFDNNVKVKGLSDIANNNRKSSKLSELIKMSAQSENLARSLDMNILNGEFLRGTNISPNIILTEDQKRQRDEMEAKQRAQEKESDAMAQATAQIRLKAETTQKDTLLMLFNKTDDSNEVLKLQLTEMILQENGTLTPEVQKALTFEQSKAKTNFEQDMISNELDNDVRELGISKAGSELDGMIPKPKVKDE